MDCFVIAVPEVALGFALAAVGGRAVSTADQARAAWDEGRTSGAKVILVSEEAWVWLADELGAWQATGKFPLVVLVPPYSGPRTPGPSLATLIRQAVGIPV